MSENRVDQQEHGYRNGHQLLATSLTLPRDDQDTVDRLSDMAGPLSPGEIFSPYLTAYPLPSRDHYVVARTWQDVDAPRAGCVLTRSILIPMTLWETIENLDGLLALLLPPKPRGNARSTVLSLCGTPPPIVHDTRVVELFEAAFLENRQPIVFFDTSEAEVITVRFLTALWPSLRRNFAVCTYTLAPRKIEGRYFDLVFAPKSASARFSGFPVRRIEASSSKVPQHHWSEATSRQIFQSDTPNLVENDALGVLTSDMQGDESALRLVLLWNELAAKSESTPTAVLGMLDILNSQSESTSQALKRLTPVIAHAVDMASNTLPELEVWYFLITLLGKFSARIPPKPVLEEIEKSAANLAKRDCETAFRFLVVQSKEGGSVPAIMLTGLGNGLSLSEAFGDLPDYLSGLPPDIGLNIFAMSASFARNTIEMLKNKPLQWMPCLIYLFQASDWEIKFKARRCFAPLVDDGAIAPLLPHVLEGVATSELVDFAIQIGHKTKFKISAFDEPLKNATSDVTSLEALRNAVASNFNNQGADRFLLGMLHLNVVNIAWLFSGALTQNRARRLLIQLLEKTSDSEVKIVQRDEATRERILKSLLDDSTLCAPQIARILTLGMPPIDQFLEISLSLLPLLQPEDSDRLEKCLLERALTEVGPGDKVVLNLLAKVGPRVDPDRLVRMVTDTTASSLRIGANIVALEATSAVLRKGILNRICDLSDRLVNQNLGNLGKEAYLAWAEMIKEAGTSSCDAQNCAAMLVLPYALRLVKFPVSPLIVVSFPIVYLQSLEQPNDEGSEFVPNLLFLPLSFFTYWGEKKTTHHKLIRDLVDAFLLSSWSPADLMLTAIDAGIEEKVIKLLRRKYKGDQYIAAIELDSQRLKKAVRKRIQENMSKC